MFIFADIDECELETDNCNSYANCTDTDGSYTCTCQIGFTGDGRECDGNAFFYNLHLQTCFFNICGSYDTMFVMCDLGDGYKQFHSVCKSSFLFVTYVCKCACTCMYV